MLAFKFSTAFIYFFAHFDLVSSVHFLNLALGCLENKDPKEPHRMTELYCIGLGN